MKIIYKVLYENGYEDQFNIDVTNKNAAEHHKIHEVIRRSFRDDIGGVICLDDSDSQRNFIRLSKVARVQIEHREDTSNESSEVIRKASQVG